MSIFFPLIYRLQVIKRYDDDHIIHYFSYKDFPSLEARPMSFKTKQNITIKGYFYSYPNYKKDRLIIFCHGFFGGHVSYMKEIERIAKEGYEVLAYDNVGCFESEGKDCRGLTESLNDLHDALNYLKETGYLENKKVSLVGHSIGGYAVSNILNYYKDIYSICAISPVASIPVYTSIVPKKYKKDIYKFEKKANPEYVDSSADIALKDTNTKVLIIHSLDDNAVSINFGLNYIKERINNPNVKYLIVDHKKHNPNYTINAVNYMNDSFSKYNELIKNKTLKTKEDKKRYMDTLDFNKMTEQDEEVWKDIIEILK